MRKIEYRAWDKVNKRMLKVNILDIQNLDKNKVFMQYTGIKDKNGKEIYESDIIENKEYKERYLVKYGEEEVDASDYEEFGISIIGFYVVPLFEQKCRTEYIFDSLPQIINDTKVVGNIYENPKLLEVDKK